MSGQMDAFSQYGLPGLVIGALFALVVFLVREHRAERKEWISAYQAVSDRFDERQQETNVVTRELVAVVREQNSRRRSND